MTRPRRQPYTKRGISRVPCIRCGAPSVHQWQICADGGQHRPCCNTCDVLLNMLVLKFMRIPGADAKIDAYIEQAKE